MCLGSCAQVGIKPSIIILIHRYINMMLIKFQCSLWPSSTGRLNYDATAGRPVALDDLHAIGAAVPAAILVQLDRSAPPAGLSMPTMALLVTAAISVLDVGPVAMAGVLDLVGSTVVRSSRCAERSHQLG